MSRRVPDDRLDAVHLVATSAMRKRPRGEYLEFRGKAVIEAHDFICILDELRQRRSSPHKKGKLEIGATTKALMAMVVGDKITLPPTTIGALTSARSTARKRLEQPDAVWQAFTLADGQVEIERMPNGSPKHYGKPKNPVIPQMAAMYIGQTMIIKKPLHNAMKQQARKIMDRVGAQWRSENLANGRIRVTRTS